MKEEKGLKSNRIKDKDLIVLIRLNLYQGLDKVGLHSKYSRDKVLSCRIFKF